MSFGQAPLLVQFSSAGSGDVDGFVSSYSWNFGDGSPAVSVPNPAHTFTAGGTYVVTLTVTDDGGLSTVNSLTVFVDPPLNLNPIASINAGPLYGKAPLAVSFNGSASSDLDGTVVSHEWDFGDGSAVDTNAVTSHTYSAVGAYVVTLKVTDDDGATDEVSTIVTVVDNVAPVAVATADSQSGKVPLYITFDGEDSYDDEDGEIVSYEWDFGDGSATQTGARVIHAYEAVGSYTATLTVTDDNGATDTATLAIEVLANQAPVAAASASPDEGKAPLGVVFDSTGTTDADGTVISYAWDFGDGQTSTSPNPSHLYTLQGSYTVVLTVTDDDGATGSQTITIEVGPPNVAPVADAEATPQSGKVPLTVDFVGSGSTDSDGTIVSYEWDFDDAGATATTADASHTYTAVGTYNARLTVTDSDGAVHTSVVTVTVNPNVAPTALATANPSSGKEPHEVTLDGTTSVDTDGTIVSYDWSFSDGTPDASGATVTHTFVDPGTYTATLTVTDDDGATDTTTVSITVNPNQAPTAVANVDFSLGNAPHSVNFNSTQSADPDGTLESFAWDFGDGNSSTDADPAHVYATPGTYSATLTVTDDNGATSTSTVTVKVLDLYNYVVEGGAGGDGSPDEPFGTIDAALAHGAANGKTGIRVAGGTYGSFTAVEGISVEGGYDQSFDLGGVDGATEAVINAAAGSAGISASNITTAVTLSNLTVNGGGIGVNADNAALNLTDLTVDAGQAPAGQSAYGIRAVNGSNVVVAGSDINGGIGGAGSAGAQGGNGAAGPDGIQGGANPAVGVPTGGAAAGAGHAASGKGADGAQNILGSTDGKDGAASASGAAGGARGVNALWGGRGGAGGSNGQAAGAAGTAATDTSIVIDANGVALPVADAGDAGGSGGGGGGAGSGRANATRSTSGASGGAGGGGGAGGAGGNAGHGSFAVFASDSVITVSDTVLTAGTGGEGGTGGAGGTGGTGGDGIDGRAAGSVGGSGGSGGGMGGTGGSGGGGGTGGPSIVIVTVGTGDVITTDATINLGTGGGAGDGGAAGAGGAGSPGGLGGGSSDANRHGGPGGAGATGNGGNAGQTGAPGAAYTSSLNGTLN